MQVSGSCAQEISVEGPMQTLLADVQMGSTLQTHFAVPLTTMQDCRELQLSD
jgi:hypothetical protein